MPTDLTHLAATLGRGELVPYLGPGALAGVTEIDTGLPLPADSDSLIIAMNQGRPMAPKLMWEFSRAAMNVELKRGRAAVIRFLNQTYGERQWIRSPLHAWLASLHLPYIIDCNRDTQLQDCYQDRPHLLIRGIARTAGADYRFRIHLWRDDAYHEIDLAQADPSLPVLFKPLGSPRPDPTYIASDADFVDYLTELMGGFGIPPFLKERRRGRRYLYLGLRLTRDTERMVLADVCFGAGSPTGWSLIPAPTPKERRFCTGKDIELIPADIPDLLAAAGLAPAPASAGAPAIGA
ncbi:MAG: SIR2 family protein [Chromatiaceae bacterium]|nr:MAG: SIR2 family protein [Chromatiaceae bacterium]